MTKKPVLEKRNYSAYIFILLFISKGVKTVEKIPCLTVRLGQAVADDTDHDLVRDQRSPVHVRLGLFPERSPRSHSGPQDIPGGDLGNPILLGQHLGLGPLARPGRAEEDALRA